MSHRKRKVLIAKMALDVHDRGMKVVARGLRDAGMEVVYLGRCPNAGAIVQTAIQEHVDVIGLSFECDNHLGYTPKLVDKMKEYGLVDVLLILGGNIPKRDIPKLKGMGVGEVFIPDTPIANIVDYIERSVKK